MGKLKSKLGSIAGMLAVITCYGTLASVALLSFVGVSVAIDEALMVKLITFLLAIALLGMLYSWRLHKNFVPLLLSLLAAGMLIWVFYGSYSKLLEWMGFSLLIVASILDFCSKKKTCPERSVCKKQGEKP